METIISLFDYSGNWSRPYKENGYNVIVVDIKHGIDILDWDYKYIKDVYGILVAIPCTDYALSGARYFKIKDEDGRTDYSNKLVKKTLEIIYYFNPVFYAIENPMSRIHKLNPEIGNPILKFQPFEYAGYDPNPEDSQYQKTTWIFGKFNIPKKKPLPNIKGNWMHTKVWGTNPECSTIRSKTPLGFAYAFYLFNNKSYILKKKSLFDFED